MNKFRLLKADEIECRIKTVTEKGCLLLLYKTARTDADLLDETVGPENWQNDFKIVDGVLYGGIGIQYPQLDEWVWKWDAGTESNTEAEKGRASDAFKRAGFKWGIGRELYSAPRTWIFADKVEIKENSKKQPVTYDTFEVCSIGYDKNGKINELSIVNNRTGEIAFQYPESKRKTEPKREPHEAANIPFLCEECKRQIADYTFANGKRDADWIGKYSESKFKKKLCGKCLAVAMKNADS